LRASPSGPAPDATARRRLKRPDPQAAVPLAGGWFLAASPDPIRETIRADQ